MICSGVNPETNRGIEIEFEERITAIRDAPGIVSPYLAPAFIDLQVNGYAGVDYNSPATPHSEITRSVSVLHATGVSRFYPTVITGGPDDMRNALANLARAKNVEIEGLHVEGPHLSSEDGPRGAHPLRWIRPPDLNEYRRWQEVTGGRIRLVTLSPHWPESTEYIQTLVRDGVTVSIGHTHAHSQQIREAVAAGATKSTHLGNAAHAMLRKQSNYIWDQLAEDRLTAGFIADGIHLERAFLKAMLRAKGVERSILVTDASAPAGTKPGPYRLGEQDVELTEDHRVVLLGTDRLAGSALRMNEGVRNLMTLGELSLRDAVRLATVNPARLAGIEGRKNGLTVGERADLILFDGNLRIQTTYVGGRRVHG